MSGEIFTAAEAEALERSMLLGLSRSPLPGVAPATFGKPLPPLACLALLAQRSRFRRPLAAADDLSRRPILPDNGRLILTGKLREDFVRLLTSHDWEASAVIAPAAFRLLHRHGLRPHPFDLPRLAPSLPLAAAELGSAEQAFLAFRAGQGVPPAHAVDPASWAELPKAERLVFIRALRNADPDRARDLIEARLPSETPALRVELIEVLRDRLGAADRDLLDRLGSDRAPSVRQAAHGLLQAIPGTPAYAERLETLARLFQVKQPGILRRRIELSFTRPPPRSGSAGPVTHGELIRGIRLADLAEALKLDLPTFVGALPPSDPELALALLSAAVMERRLDLVPALSARVVELGLHGVLIGLASSLEVGVREDREEILRLLFSICSAEAFPEFLLWTIVGRKLPDGLPGDMADAVLGWGSWRAYLADACKASNAGDVARNLLALAVLMPHPQAAAFARELESMPPEMTEKAVAYARFVSAVATLADSPSHLIGKDDP